MVPSNPRAMVRNCARGHLLCFRFFREITTNSLPPSAVLPTVIPSAW